jgi:6-pyruvoyltetrahydropterin/6-carboxytetrahydropterin synthase
MYELVVEQHLEAAHYLRGYQGKCENLHGHRYSVVVRLQTGKLNEIGLAYDFTEIKKHLKEIMARMDHVCLNDIQPFDRINPSAENIATTIYHELASKINDPDIKIAAVEAWENPLQGAIYSPDK